MNDSDSVYEKMKMLRHNKTIYIAIIIVFICISLMYICPPVQQMRSQYISSQLEKTTVETENTERTDYLDANGQLTIAADLGYATVIISKTEKSRLEQYFDNKGEPISRLSGYYALLQEYDDKGNNIRIIYLNRDCEPMSLANGCAMEKKEYNEKGQAVLVRYFDLEEKPILTPAYGYGRINEYDENGRIHRITFIDAYGAPMMTVLGYAIVSRYYYITDGPENGKVEVEFYFDEKGKPVSLSLGQYGVHKEYDENGRESVLIYLDAEGNPMISTRGYTTVFRTFHPNGAVATERYYDLNGQPYSLSEGQYGQRTENGQTVYLNADGSEQFNLKNFLYNQSWSVIVLAVIAVFISSVVGRKVSILLLILYIFAIGYLTLMFRESGDKRINLTLFWSYRKLLSDSESRASILRNIWLFIPLGAILYRLYPTIRVLLFSVALSVLIEAVQYYTGSGLCELDDVISNSIGAFIGFFAAQSLCEVKDRIFRNTHKRVNTVQ